jgi:hypothetical protein
MRHLLAVAALVAAFVFLAPVASAHEWFTGTGCCDGDDCKPWVPTVNNYIPSEGGVTIRLNRSEILEINPESSCESVNEFIPKDSYIMKDSPVSSFGICLLNGTRNDGTCVRCLFEPGDI